MSERFFAFKTTIPILLGYAAIGCAFGLMIENAGYPWYLAFLMSAVIYAGAGQYAAVGMFAGGAGFWDIAVATFLINSRHMVYGISLTDKFRGTGAYKPYMIFALTDETYGVMTVTTPPAYMDSKTVYFYIALFNHLYWIMGSMIGYLAGAMINFDFNGVGFALTALFVVLLIEQWKNHSKKIPFAIAFVCTLLTLTIAGSTHMLIISFVLSITALVAFKRFILC